MSEITIKIDEPIPTPSLFNCFFDDFALLYFLNDVDHKPPTNIIEKKKDYKIVVELPGIKADDIKISISNNILNIAGIKKKQHKASKETFSSIECDYGKYSRDLMLPRQADGSKTSASFEDGVLEIVIPKRKNRKNKKEKNGTKKKTKTKQSKLAKGKP